MQRLRDTGSWAAKPRGGGTSPLEQHKELILAVVSERPDATLKEILAALHKQGIYTNRSALDRFLARHKVTRKKKILRAAEQKRKDVARARRKWILIRSRYPSANSRPTCVGSHSAPSRASATPFALSSHPSRSKNAPTISGMPAMLPYDREPL